MNRRDLTRNVFLVENAYTEQECLSLIAESETHAYHPAPIAQVLIVPEIRNNTRVMFDDPRLAATILERLRPHLPEQVEPGWHLQGINERIRFYRYDPGERFAWHLDAVFHRTDTEWSWLTLMIYLNDNFEGGATSFYDDSAPGGFLRVTPKTGTVLLFRHDELLRHAGEKVTTGRKYVLRTDVMYRLRAFER